MISAVCPHVTLFGSTPLYEHLRVFSCACYPNITATAPQKLAPRSTRCIFLSYSADHKGYMCLDLSTNHLIVSCHVVFDEDSFLLAASPNLTDLDFLCDSGAPVSTIGTPVSPAGSPTTSAYQPIPVVPPSSSPRRLPCLHHYRCLRSLWGSLHASPQHQGLAVQLGDQAVRPPRTQRLVVRLPPLVVQPSCMQRLMVQPPPPAV
jgi:hypothetical protein